MNVARCCNELLLERFTQLEPNNLNRTQYNKTETVLETKPVSSHIANTVLNISYRNISRTRPSVILSLYETVNCLLRNLNAEIMAFFLTVKF